MVKPRPDEAAALAEEGGEPADTLHVTLALLGDTDESDLRAVVDALKPVAARHGPLTGTVGGVGSFDDNGNGHPAILLPDVAGLVELRQAVCEALQAAGITYARTHGFQPHLTIRYGDGDPPAEESVGAPLHFDDLVLARGDVPTSLPLVGVKPVTASAVVAESEIGKRIAAVAEEHAPEGGYGDTAWNAATKTVYWVSADWTSNEDCDAARDAFLAIDGVEKFEYDAEACVPDGDGWEPVFCTSACGGCGRAVTAAAGSPEAITAAIVRVEERRSELSAALRGADDAAIQAAKQSLKAAQKELFALSGQLPDPGWTAPMPDQVVDARGLANALRGKTDPVRLALIEAVARETVEQAGVAWDISNPYIGRALASSASQVTNIADTTRGNVMAIIAEAYDLGLSIPDTARMIQAGMRAATPARATLIARTEMTGAVNAGSLAAVQVVDSVSEGAGHSKVWLTAQGARYPRHEEYEDLDHQAVPLDAYFKVGNAELQFPGDPEGSPEEVCNCRCAIAYAESGAAE